MLSENEKQLPPGARVRVTAPSPRLKLRSDTGTIVCKDEDLDYYIIRLDKPARLRVEGQSGRRDTESHDVYGLITMLARPRAKTYIDLSEIREDIDNFEIIDQ